MNKLILVALGQKSVCMMRLGVNAKGLPSVSNVYVDTLCLYTHSYD